MHQTKLHNSGEMELIEIKKDACEKLQLDHSIESVLND